ncbi:GNAT family N-acetyltransferase [Dokdonella sp.]|uniref:GNAT family N-acetyltransferase n=1 Tax=Dokdonella sp. TaxID=2291710 RepID=UPI001B0B9D5F|nr:GNAT family N-acetyltransferase [Dokdonella sp.]MBO9662644.1 N-acetyltransferase [Dokdonella sp.]
MADEIIDNRARHRYELSADGYVAHVDYERAPGTITFIHTIVPEELGGRGIGSKLARRVLDDARAAGEKVIAQCPFIAAYIGKHPEYQDLVQA